MGGVVHFEIPVDDLDAASRFYADVFGWKLEPFGDVGYLLAATTPTGPDGRRPSPARSTAP